jgi:hypothetical protein
MPTYRVNVDKSYYATGSIDVEAKTPAKAIAKVNSLIARGKLNIDDIDNWGDIEYQIGSFKTTEDVEEL